MHATIMDAIKVKETYSKHFVLIDDKGNSKKNFRDGLRDRVWKTRKGAENWAKNKGYTLDIK